MGENLLLQPSRNKSQDTNNLQKLKLIDFRIKNKKWMS